MLLDLDGAWVVLFGLSTKKIGSCTLFVFVFVLNSWDCRKTATMC